MSSCPCLLSCSLPLPSLYHAVPSSSDNCFSRSPKVPTSLGFILLTLFFSLYTLSLCFVSYTYRSLGKINPDGLTQWSWEMARTHLASWFLNLDSYYPQSSPVYNPYHCKQHIHQTVITQTREQRLNYRLSVSCYSQPFTKSNGISCKWHTSPFTTRRAATLQSCLLFLHVL